MDEKDIPPKIRKEIVEHLAMAQYALFYVSYLLRKLAEKKSKKDSTRTGNLLQ